MREGFIRHTWNRNFTSVFDTRTSFCAWRVHPAHLKSQFYLSFWHSNLVLCVKGTLEIAILPQFLTLEPRFVREGFIRHAWNRNFTSVFDTRTSFRAWRVHPDKLKSQFYLSFWHSNLVSCVKGSSGQVEIAILPQFLTLEPRFVREGWRFVIRRRHCPRPKERKKKKERVKRERETERREREREREKERERERKRERMWGCEDVKMWRCEDVKMWKMWRCGCEDVKMCRCEDMRMWRCEDVKMWGCEDVKMWWCEDVKMWRCEDVKLWRCEDVMMWRCESMQIQLLEEPFAQTLSGKTWGYNDSPKNRRVLDTQGIYQSVRLSSYALCVIQQSIYPSVYPTVYLPIYQSISLSLSIPLSIHRSTSLSLYLSIYLSIHPSIHLSIHPSIHLSLSHSVSLSLSLSPHRAPQIEGGRRHLGASPFYIYIYILLYM